MPDEPAVLFLDTTILLHYKPLRDVDWKAVADAETVRLVLCAPVLAELDERKWNPQTAEAARAALAQVKQIRQSGGRVQDGVTLDVVLGDDQTSTGDRDAAIVRQAGLFRDANPTWRVAVVSGNYNMTLRCGAKGIACIEPPERWLQGPQDAVDRDPPQPQQRYQPVRSPRPDCRLTARIVTGGGSPPKAGIPVELTRLAKVPVHVAARMREIRQQHPKIESPERPTRGVYVNTDTLGTARQARQEIDRYNSDLDAFYQQYEAALNGQNREAEARARSFCFELWLENDAETPATDVEVCVAFPADVVDIRPADESLTHAAKVPGPPREPRTAAEMIKDKAGTTYGFRAQQTSTPAPSAASRSEACLSDPIRAVGDQMEIHQTIDRVEHHVSACLGMYRAAYPDWESIEPFEATYRLQAGQSPEPITGRLSFDVSKAGRD